MKIAIVGATGNVGRKIIEVLEQKKNLVEDLCLLASKKSTGTELLFNGKKIKVSGFGLTIIKKLFELIKLNIFFETNAGLIIPIGFNSDLKGPSTIFLILNLSLESLSRRFFLKEINFPINDLLIS